MNPHTKQGIIFITGFYFACASIAETNVFVQFTDFSSTGGLALNGDATTVSTPYGVALRVASADLYTAGSAFSTNQVNATSFSTVFSFRYSETGGSAGGADGICFTVQSIDSSVGTAGGGMGYLGLTNSVAVEFDIYNNEYATDPDDSHIAINADGVFDGSPVSVLPAMKNGDQWYAWVDYDGTVLEARLSLSDQRPNEPTISRTISITNILESQTAYIGFSGATGRGWANHDILLWQFNSEFGPITNIPIKEPELIIYPAVELAWSSVSGHTYQVQYSADLLSTNWFDYGEPVLGTGNTNFVFDNTRNSTNRFYRVIVDD